ncbi:unnamed protein product [Rangifer tarandus platyrhynchus]|uniref:Uncharacterized protein n=1 Tax=Rangifer tarandus platyrhynchus TaxID=3082113 RepID=A0ABN8ZI34_RANTA|nr:unnamed protein product [Rangifer tarandus platyrhynchus]
MPAGCASLSRMRQGWLSVSWVAATHPQRSDLGERGLAKGAQQGVDQSGTPKSRVGTVGAIRPPPPPPHQTLGYRTRWSSARPQKRTGLRSPPPKLGGWGEGLAAEKGGAWGITPARRGGVYHAHSLRLGGNVEPSPELTSPEAPGRRPCSLSYRMFPLNLTFQKEQRGAVRQCRGAGSAPGRSEAMLRPFPARLQARKLQRELPRFGRGAGPRDQLPSSYELL